MNSKKLFKDLSANTIQTGITQLAGLVIFYILSRYISKEDFGEYNWTTAVGSTIIAVGSLGLDLVLVKRIAAGQNPRLMAGVHFFHTLLVGILLLICLFLIQLLFPGLLQYHSLFMLILVQLTVANIANSFKFSLTGMEAFKALATISVCLNILKLITVIGLLAAHYLSIKNAVLGFLLASITELLISYYFINKKINVRLAPLFRKKTYKGFIIESLPQLGVVLFDSALARIDWILLGIFSTVSITAEYSFAYKFFELSKLPLLVLAPVLLTRFSKLYNNKEPISSDKQHAIQQFFNFELFIAFLIPIFMVCVWTDLIDLITANKYGAVNQTTYSILALCVPLHFIINFLWTMGFVQSQLKEIMFITIGSSIINLVLNIILIPKYGSTGAATAFLFSSLLQVLVYMMTIKKSRMKISTKALLLFSLCGLSAVFTAKYLFINNYWAAIVACLLYAVFSLAVRELFIVIINYKTRYCK